MAAYGRSSIVLVDHTKLIAENLIKTEIVIIGVNISDKCKKIGQYSGDLE